MTSQPLTGTFTATGNSNSFAPGGQPYTLTLSGTWSGTVALQRSGDRGRTWATCTKDDGTAYSWTSNLCVQVNPTSDTEIFRLSYTHTSGTQAYRLDQGRGDAE